MPRPVGWRTATIEEIAEKVGMGPFGSSIKVETFVPEGIPIISGQHLHGARLDEDPGFKHISPEHAQRLVNSNVFRGDIVLTHRGTLGQVALIPDASKFERYIVSQSQFYIRCDRSKVDPEFVTLYLKSPEGQHQLLANSSQVGVPSIAQPVTYLRSIEIPIPPLPEQQDIAHVLGTLDDKIELNRRMNRNLEEMARAIFQDWFVDFGPTKAKMEGLDPYLPPELWDLFPDELVDSELGEIPEGWKVETLSTYSSLNPESWTKKNFPDDIEYVDLANTKWGTITSTQHFPRESAPSRARRVLRAGDTVIGTVRPGNGSFSLVGRDNLTGSTGFAVLRPIRQQFRALIYLAASNPDNIERLTHRADGGAYPAVRPEVVAESQVVSPVEGTDLLDRFSDMISPLLDKMESNQTETRSLMALRNEMLPSLVSGELRLEDGPGDE